LLSFLACAAQGLTTELATRFAGLSLELALGPLGFALKLLCLALELPHLALETAHRLPHLLSRPIPGHLDIDEEYTGDTPWLSTCSHTQFDF
jgi:hypothetical protein